MEREHDEADVESAPEGAAEEARPDTEEGDEGTVTDPDAEQQDPESGPAAS